MFTIVWAILAMLAAGASIVLVLDTTTRAGGMRATIRAIDAEAGRPGLRDRDLGRRMAGHPVPTTVAVTSGSRYGGRLLLAAASLVVFTFGALVTGSGYTVLLATLSLCLSGFIVLRLGNSRQLRVDSTRVRLRRWRTHFDIPIEAVYGVGLVPSRDPGVLGHGQVWLSLWCDPVVVTGLPDPLTDTVAVGPQVAWLRLDPVEAVSTAQLLQLWQFFAARWTVGDEDGVVHPAPSRDMSELFADTGRLDFDPQSGHYTKDDEPVGHVVRRLPSHWQVWRTWITRNTASLPHTFEVRDSLLQTRWIISKPDAAWKTAFYITDRYGKRVGTLRSTSASSSNFDLCGVDNRVLATLRPAQPRSTVVDIAGTEIASWDADSGQVVSNAAAGLRVMCLLSPIVARFAPKKPHPSAAETVEVDVQVTQATTVPLHKQSLSTTLLGDSSGRRMTGGGNLVRISRSVPHQRAADRLLARNSPVTGTAEWPRAKAKGHRPPIDHPL